MNETSKKLFWWGIIGLVCLRFLLVFLLMNNIPFTDMRFGGFRPNFTGSYWPDEIHYFELGQSFSKLSAVPNVANIGYPLFLAPIIHFTNANGPIDIAQIVFIIQAFLFFSLAIILVGFIALEIFKKKSLALITAAIFTVYPYLLLIILKLAHFPRWLPAFHYQMWIVIGADYLSAVLLYLGLYLFIKRFNTEKLNITGIILIAVFLSAAALVRVANIFYLPLIFLILIWLKKYKESITFSAVSFLVYLPQWIYNFYFFGSPFTYGYRIKELSGHGLEAKIIGNWFSLDNILIFFNRVWQNLPAFSWFLPILILIVALGFWRLFKQNKILSLILIFWALLNIGFYISFVDAQSQLRYFIPSIPPLIILFISGIMFLYEYRRNIQKNIL